MLTAGENEQRMVPVGGQTWRAQLVRRVALFPLRAGDLSTGAMSVTLTGNGFRGGGVRGGMVRESKPIVIHVTEPPTDGRPTGYVVGDVGSWSLGATVEPRSVPAGGSIAVNVLLRGTGNPPGNVRIPEQKGITWLEPEIHETIDVDRPKVSANKTFTYVVSLREPGRVDLGEIKLPYWDPDKKVYLLARVSLGAIDVTGKAPAPPSASAASSASAPPADPFAIVAPARSTLGAHQKPTRPWTDSAWFWGLLLGAPLLVVAGEGATRTARKLRAARLASLDEAGRKIDEALAEADLAAESGDKKRAAAAVERAINASAEAATGIKIRGLLRADLVGALEGAGLPNELAQAVHDLLARGDTWRFDPSGDAGDSPVAEARALVKRLGKAGPKG
jgi:hypothetical protein